MLGQRRLYDCDCVYSRHSEQLLGFTPRRFGVVDDPAASVGDDDAGIPGGLAPDSDVVGDADDDSGGPAVEGDGGGDVVDVAAGDEATGSAIVAGNLLRPTTGGEEW